MKISRLIPLLPLLALLLPPLLSSSARATVLPITRARCMARAEELPDFAFVEAQAWEKQGGGMDAQLCQAMARLFQGEYRDAAQRLEAVIPVLGSQVPAVDAGLWAKAGWAWLNAKEMEKAEVDYTKALSLTPDDLDLVMDRATERSLAQRFWDALSDLDKVVARDPKRVEALVMRAEVRRKLSRDAESAQDLVSALAQQPDNVQALLQLGNVRADQGQDEKARALWTRARQLAGDSAAGQAAAANLARLDNHETAGGEAGAKPDEAPQKVEKPLFGK